MQWPTALCSAGKEQCMFSVYFLCFCFEGWLIFTSSLFLFLFLGYPIEKKVKFLVYIFPRKKLCGIYFLCEQL